MKYQFLNSYKAIHKLTTIQSDAYQMDKLFRVGMSDMLVSVDKSVLVDMLRLVELCRHPQLVDRIVHHL